MCWTLIPSVVSVLTKTDKIPSPHWSFLVGVGDTPAIWQKQL